LYTPCVPYAFNDILITYKNKIMQKVEDFDISALIFRN
jgi:hypothetical protein